MHFPSELLADWIPSLATEYLTDDSEFLVYSLINIKDHKIDSLCAKCRYSKTNSNSHKI